MKNSNPPSIRVICYNVFILGFLVLVTACKNEPSKAETSKPETEAIVKVEPMYWQVKAIAADGQRLDIKVYNNEGKPFDIKAVQNADQDSFLDVKAFVEAEQLPVKIVVSSKPFAPVVAISKKGNTYSISAITPEGEKLEVVGVARFDNVVVIKAVTKKGKFYDVKAISPSEQLNTIKGIKINIQDREMSLKGNSIYAHVKAMHPSDNEAPFKMPKKNKKNKKKGEYKSNFKRIIWPIKAVTTDGKKLEVKAFDAQGNAFDVKATQDSKDYSFMNIKAFVDGAELPVKIMHSTDEYSPIKAIGKDGTIYDIKAITDSNVKLDVKGVSRFGTIINVKAINDSGEFYGVKAFGPNGKFNAIKGVKIFEREVELKIQGNPVYAHLKAINQ